MKHWYLRIGVTGLMLLLGASIAQSAEFNLDFETDPEALGVEFFGTSEWRDTDGFENSGYLSITDALNGQRGAIVFPDLENGQQLTAFRITADLRVGGGTSSPADGFSFNFARPGDPVLDDGEGWASSPTNEANLPEEGTTTGLAIGFDEWFSGGSDVVGMSIRIDNKLVNQFPFPVLNGEVDDTESLQTGPSGVFDDELQDLMGWARLTMELCANNLTVTYKGVEVFNEVVEYDPSPGLLVFGGRTGDANAYHHIDNISIKTNADVGAGCTVIPPSFIAGENTIGVRTLDSVQSNTNYNAELLGAPGFLVDLVDTDVTVGTQTIAEAVFNDPNETHVTEGYDLVDLGGGDGTFFETLGYPNGVDVGDTSMEDFVIRATAKVVIPAGTWTVGFGSDDGGQLTIPGVTFENTLNSNTIDGNEIRFEDPRGHSWTVGSFTLTEPLETVITTSMFERGGGDSFEVAVINDEAIEAADPNLGWELLGDGVFGWEVDQAKLSLLSADLTSDVSSERPIQFDVNGDTGQADQMTIANPDPDVYTTIVNLDNLTFQIKSAGTVSSGEAFRIVDADKINGNVTLQSVNPGQNWVWDQATGRVCLDTCPPIGGGDFDFDGDGMLGLGDVNLLLAQVNSGANNPTYDVNSDGLVNEGDINSFVTDADKLNTYIGDADLNGEFTSADFVTVFLAGEYEDAIDDNSLWEEGDWNGDLDFTSSDFVSAFLDGGYEAGPKAAVSAVPEPSSLVLALLSLLGVVGFARKRQ